MEYKILFVCTGNICRSPTAEGILRRDLIENHLDQIVFVDSAGTTGYHSGQQPDKRAISAASKRNASINSFLARKITTEDFHSFDLILAMDYGHLSNLESIKPANSNSNLELFLEYTENNLETEVPDPYYGSEQDFEYVLDLIEDGSQKLIKKLKNHVI